MEHRYYDLAEPERNGQGDQDDDAKWWKTASRQKRQTKTARAKKTRVEQRKKEGEGCKGPRAVTPE